MKLGISHANKTSYLSLEAKLLPEQWDGYKVVNHPDILILTTYITEIKAKLDSYVLMLARENRLDTYSAVEIRDSFLEEINPEMKKEKEDKTTFLFRFNQYASRMKPGSKKTFDHTLNRLVAFTSQSSQIPLDKLRFEDMTIDWLKSFDNFMSSTSGRNSRNIHFCNIRTVFNDAIDDNITSFYPFRRFMIKNEQTKERCITVEELRRLIFFECEEDAKMYRDYFVHMFYLMGINNVDLCKVKDIEKGRFNFHRKKRIICFR